MSECVAPSPLAVHEAYQLWASEYDSAPNALLRLEERHLAPWLPTASGCDAIDLGCGTGRWLERIYTQHPRSLTGVDFSAAMLKRAAQKLGQNARLLYADCLHTPLESSSADWILASFLLSYVDNLRKLASEMARIARPGAWVLLSDMHPATRSFGWRRTFRHGNRDFEIQTHPYSLQGLHRSMNEAGFLLESLNEHCFGDEEKVVFIQAGRPDLHAAVKGLPALSIVRYRKRPG